MKAKFYLIIFLVNIVSVAFGKGTIDTPPRDFRTLIYSSIITLENLDIFLMKEEVSSETFLKFYMAGPTEFVLREETNHVNKIEFQKLDQTNLNQINATNTISTIDLIDVEYESNFLIPNSNISLNFNSDLFSEPLFVNPNIGFSLTSVLFQTEITPNLNLQIYTQPRVYVFNFESTYIDEDNNKLMDLESPSQSLNYLSPEINLGIVLGTNNFSLEYSRTSEISEWGEIEFQYQFN